MRTPHNDSSSRLHRTMQPAVLPSTVSARSLYRVFGEKIPHSLKLVGCQVIKAE